MTKKERRKAYVEKKNRERKHGKKKSKEEGIKESHKVTRKIKRRLNGLLEYQRLSRPSGDQEFFLADAI